jgi:hypothetical protein
LQHSTEVCGLAKQKQSKESLQTHLTNLPFA